MRLINRFISIFFICSFSICTFNISYAISKRDLCPDHKTKTVLITGSSSGIGKATAKLFLEKGWNVIATMRSPEKEEELTTLNNVFVTKLDVTDLDSINLAVKSGIERFGKIDVLVNNAGYSAIGPLETFPRESIVRIFDTNVIGLIDVIRALLPHFRKNKSGIIINISSISGKTTHPLLSLYSGTKFAVEGLSGALSYELEPFNVKVKIIEPGNIATKNFLGRSLDLQSSKNTFAEYLPMLNILTDLVEEIRKDKSRLSPVSDVTEAIYKAATDNSNTLRYKVGKDADFFLDLRKNNSDEEYMKKIKEIYGI